MFKKKKDNTLKIVLGTIGLGITVVGAVTGRILWKRKKENKNIEAYGDNSKVDCETCILPEEAIDDQQEEIDKEVDESLIDEIVKKENSLTEEELKLLSEL